MHKPLAVGKKEVAAKGGTRRDETRKMHARAIRHKYIIIFMMPNGIQHPF